MRQIIRTTEGLTALPVGSVVMTLWDNGPLHYVMQKYSNGWYGWPSDNALYPLGARTEPRAVLVLWNPDIDTEPT